MLVYYLVTLCSVPFWLLLLSLSHQFLEPFLSCVVRVWWVIPQPRLAFGCSLWPGSGFLRPFLLLLLSWLRRSSGVSRTVYRALWNRNSYPLSAGLAFLWLSRARVKAQLNEFDQYLFLVQSWPSRRARYFPLCHCSGCFDLDFSLLRQCIWPLMRIWPCGRLACSYHVYSFNMVTGVAIALMIPAAGALLVSTIMVLPASIARVWENF